MTSRLGALRPLFGMAFLDVTYISLTFPLITLIFFDTQSRLFAADTPFAVRSVWFGLCVSLPNILNMLITPFLCALSDTWGRKTILLIECSRAIIFSLTVAIGIASGALWLVFLGFIVKGAFAKPNPTALAMVGDVAPKDKKLLYMGYLQFAISVGASMGPVLGGYLASRYLFNVFNFSIPFFIAATLASLNLLFMVFCLHETLTSRVAKQTHYFHLRTLLSLLKQPAIRFLALLLFFLQISWSVYYQFIPAILKSLYHFNSHQLGWFIGMIAVWLALCTGIGIKCLHAFLSLRHMMMMGLYLILIGLLMTLISCAMSASPLLSWLSAIPTAMGDVIAYSCLVSLYSNMVASEEQGKVMGICFIVATAAWTITGLAGGLLMSLSPLLPLFIAPISVMIALTALHAKAKKSLLLSYDQA